MKDGMLDLETFGTDPDAPVIAIGCVEFDAEGIGSTFYRIIDLSTIVGNPNMDTIRWWMNQSDEARNIFKDSAPTVSIQQALVDFSEWVNTTGIKRVWGNSASFDNVILRNTYKECGLKAPWMWWNDMCYRTIKNLHSGIKMSTRSGTHHNAVDDAISQAQHLIEINNLVKVGL